MYAQEYKSYIRTNPVYAESEREVRNSTSRLLPVYSFEGNEVIGKVINYSKSGMCLMLNDSITDIENLKLRIGLNNHRFNNALIEIECSVIWSVEKGLSSVLVGIELKPLNMKSKLRYISFNQ